MIKLGNSVTLVNGERGHVTKVDNLYSDLPRIYHVECEKKTYLVSEASIAENDGCSKCGYGGNILMMRPPECPDAYTERAKYCGQNSNDNNQLQSVLKNVSDLYDKAFQTGHRVGYTQGCEDGWKARTPLQPTVEEVFLRCLSFHGTFLDAVDRGEISIDRLGELVDCWNRIEQPKKPLREVIGLSEKDMEAWNNSDEVLKMIAERRKY